MWAEELAREALGSLRNDPDQPLVPAVGHGPGLRWAFSAAVGFYSHRQKWSPFNWEEMGRCSCLTGEKRKNRPGAGAKAGVLVFELPSHESTPLSAGKPR